MEKKYYLYRLKYYWAVPHSGYLYKKGAIFISSCLANSPWHIIKDAKVCQIATPRLHTGYRKELVLEDLSSLGFLEPIEEIPKELLPHISKTIKTLFSL